jgi:hypothetical protein
MAGCVVVMKEQYGTCSNFLLRSPGKLHNWYQWCLPAHGLFGDGLCGWVLEFLNIFCRSAGAWSPWTFVILQQTLDRPWNVNVIQKPLSGLKNFLQKPLKAFQGFWQWIYQASRKTCCRYVAWFAIHSRQNRTWCRKSTLVKTMRVQSTVSRDRLTQ